MGDPPCAHFSSGSIVFQVTAILALSHLCATFKLAFFSPTCARIRDFIGRRQARSVGSQLIEDSFGCLKRKVDTKSNDMCTSDYAWATLVDRKVLSSKHNYQEVNRLAEVHERNAAPPPRCHTPVLQKNRLDPVAKAADFSSIAGLGDASWFSPSATNLFLPYADLEACRAAAAAGQLGNLHLRSYSRLINKHVVFREKGSGSWQLGLGNIDGCVGVSWPVVEAADGCFTVEVKPNTVRNFVTVLNPNNYEAVPISWASPMRRAIMQELANEGKDGFGWHQVSLKQASSYGALSIGAQPLGPVAGLLQTAASQGFWDLPVSYLRDLSEKLELEVKGTSLIKVLETLSFHLIPGLTNEMFLRILDLRGLHVEQDLAHCDYLVCSGYAADCFDRAFAEQVAGEMREAKQTKEFHDEFIQELMKLKVIGALVSCVGGLCVRSLGFPCCPSFVFSVASLSREFDLHGIQQEISEGLGVLLLAWRRMHSD